MTQDPVIRDVLARRQSIDGHCAPSESIHQVANELEEELAALREEIVDRPDRRSWKSARDRLIAIMALAYRGCRDLRIETTAAAIEKDIPF